MSDTIASEDLDTDLTCAAGTTVRVLITGPLDVGRFLANHIHALAVTDAPLVRIDCRGPEAEVAAALHAAVRGKPCTLLLEDVAALSAGLKRYLGDHLGDPRIRVLATNGGPAHALCRPGGFDERTFYRLNTIHIVVDRADIALAALTARMDPQQIRRGA